MRKNIDKIVFSQEDISKKVTELGKMISSDYNGKNLILVGVLKGSMFFVADLMRKLDIPVIIDFIGVSSYGEANRSSGAVRIIKDLEENIEGKSVLIVEDIIDTGLTIGYIAKTLALKKPSDIKLCVMVDKNRNRIHGKLKYTWSWTVQRGLNEAKDSWRHFWHQGWVFISD